MKNDNVDILLSVAIAKKKAIIILSLIEKEDIYNEVTQGIMENMELELLTKQKGLRIGRDGKQFLDNGFIKEYHDNEGKGKFIMTGPQKFRLEFGQYKYDGYFPIGTREKFNSAVKEITFYVSNAMKVEERPTSLKINRFSISGIKNIQL